MGFFLFFFFFLFFSLASERVFSYDNTRNGLAYIAYYFVVERLGWSWISIFVYTP